MSAPSTGTRMTAPSIDTDTTKGNCNRVPLQMFPKHSPDLKWYHDVGISYSCLYSKFQFVLLKGKELK